MSTSSVTEISKRSVECPKCGARVDKPCRSSRIPGANTLGGGWSGPPILDTSHNERRLAYLHHVASWIDANGGVREAMQAEQRILGVGSEFLPKCARTVRDGGEATAEYWDYLLSQREGAWA